MICGEDGGVDSLAAVRVLTEEHLRLMGLSIVHAAVVMSRLRPAPVVVPVVANGPGFAMIQQAGAGVKVEVKFFPRLSATGWPERLDWLGFVDMLASAVAGAASSGLADVVRQAGTTGVAPLVLGGLPYVAGGDDDQTVWRLYTGAGPEGMPLAMLQKLPNWMREGRCGLAAVAETAAKVLAGSDGAAEVVHMWIENPPVVQEKKKFQLQAVLSQWTEQVARCAALGDPLSEVSRRLSLRKVVSKLPEVLQLWSAQEAQLGREPTVAELMPTLTRKAGAYTAVS